MTDTDPLDRGGMRRHNLALVLRAIAAGTRPSRADIALTTSLHKTTVSSLVAELIERELVREAGKATDGNAGRPATALSLAGERYLGLGLEINVDHLSCTVLDLGGRVHERLIVPRDNRASPAAATIRSLAELIAEPRRRLERTGAVVMGMTLALPGLVDPRAGRLLLAPNLGWRDVPVVDQLRAALDAEVPALRIDNEANLAALAERWQGAGREHRDFVYVSGYIGIGAGIVSDGTLHRGESGFGGEFGHLTLEPDGPPCACGSRGCVEALAGLGALLRHPAVVAAGWTDAAEIADAAMRDDAGALAAVEAVGTALGIGLASTANLLGSRAIVLGGYFATLFPWLRGAIERELRARVLAHSWSPVAVLRSALPAGAASSGAAASVLRAIFEDPSGTPPPA